MVSLYDTTGYQAGETESQTIENIIRKFNAGEPLSEEDKKELATNPTLQEKLSQFLSNTSTKLKVVGTKVGDFAQEHFGGDTWDAPGPRPLATPPTTPMAEEGFMRGLQTVSRQQPRGGLIDRGYTHKSQYYGRKGYLALPRVKRPPRFVPFMSRPVNPFKEQYRSGQSIGRPRLFKPHIIRPKRRRPYIG